MRVLVAGASGAIGRPLVTALLARGHTVIGWSPSYPSYRQGVAEMVGPVRVGGHPDE